MKNLKLYLFTLITFMFIGLVNVNAEETIKELAPLKACLSSDIVVCTLGADIAVDDSMFVKGSDVTLDLNGYTISLDKDVYEQAIIVVEHGAKLTIKDSSENKTGKLSYITDLTTDEVRTAIKLTKSKGDNSKVAELIINGGTIEGDSYAISGNGNPGRNNTKTTINDGIFFSKGTGIFQPQDGVLIINGGTIEGKTGIEVRSGKLTVNGGTIIGTEKPTITNKNGNGTTTTGAGVAVVQHTTVLDINVIINGGTIKGYTPFYQTSSETNSDSSKVKLTVNGGNFVIINDGENALYSNDKNAFVAGGVYTNDIDEKFLAENVVSKKIGDTYTVGKENPISISKVTAGEIKVDKTAALVGETVTITLTPNEGYELDNLLVVEVDTNNEIEVVDGKFTMPNKEVGVSAVFKKIEVTTEIPVVNLETEVKEATVAVKEETKVEEVLLESLEKNTDLKDAIADTSVKVEVAIDKVEVEEKVEEAMKEVAGKATIATYFDITINVLKASDNTVLGTLPNLTKEIELMIVLPENLKNNDKDVNREYFVIRQHEDNGKEEITKIPATLSEDGKYLVFKSDSFSTYALAYEDTAVEAVVPETPQTGDSVILYIALGFVSIAAIGVALNNLKRREIVRK